MENSHWFSLAISATALLVIELAYFKIAERFRIIDKPNERSSHSHPIIRGGGIIFLFGILIWFVQNDYQFPWFVLAVVLITIVSFLDDITSQHAAARFAVHLISMLLLMYQLWPLPWSIYLVAVAVIVCIGTLNAFNFMDGINGITGVYALVTLVTFAVVNNRMVLFTNESLLLITIASVIIFLFFNFRKVARCFAGDVGSVTIALILIFVLLQLIHQTNNFLWPLLFLVYGTDSVVTIIYRLKRRENIFKAHRTHLFQYLSNEMKIPHLMVSSIYGVVQGMLNLIFVISFNQSNYVLPIAISIAFVGFYFALRRRVILIVNASKA